MTEDSKTETYDGVLFGILALEFPGDDPAGSQRKIKRKLGRLGLGAYEQERVDYVRNLKNDLQNEIGLSVESNYYLRSFAATADPRDFDYDRLVVDFRRKYPKISKADMRTIVTFAISAYYLR